MGRLSILNRPQLTKGSQRCYRGGQQYRHHAGVESRVETPKSNNFVIDR
jgi:hypothetical protein